MILGQALFSVQPTHAKPDKNSLFVCFHQGRILLCETEGTLTLPMLSALSLPEECDLFELAHSGEAVLFSPPPFSPYVIDESDGFRYYETNVFRDLPYDVASLIVSCLHLWNWYQMNRFCGRCGHTVEPDHTERALRCSHCGRMIFPTIAPAVIVAITCGDKILLARNKRNTFYGLIAGFVEVGETLEHAVQREALEEVGLHLHALRYIGNQPWGSGGSHMFGFYAEADANAPICLQESELQDARWFDRSELEPRQHTASIAFELIERFRQGTL